MVSDRACFSDAAHRSPAVVQRDDSGQLDRNDDDGCENAHDGDDAAPAGVRSDVTIAHRRDLHRGGVGFPFVRFQ